MRKVKRMALYILMFVFVGLVAGFILTPDFEEIQNRALSSERVVYSEDGQILQTIRQDLKSRRLPWLELKHFSKPIRKTVLLAEDRRFYSHLGVDFAALIRASLAMSQGKRVQGASTITMQLSDLIRPEVLSGKGRIVKGRFDRKLIQIVKALFIEMRLSKKQIFESYLNLIHLRGEHQGVHTVARAYYQMPASNLDERKAAVIAALIASPNTSKKNIEQRACSYLEKLRDETGSKTLSCDEAFGTDLNLALALREKFVPQSLDLAPHIARLMTERFPEMDRYQTTLDKDLQKRVSEILFQNVHRLRDKDVNDGAAIVIDVQTKEVKAYVGAVEKTSKFGDVDGIQGSRQA
ncbi:MAG: transglycosylase domain-containing protein, partial [Bdellovibrionales bacterium]|nr:transglycosylase domain-containing protein [Bdellovibrionales bacterium]